LLFAVAFNLFADEIAETDFSPQRTQRVTEEKQEIERADRRFEIFKSQIFYSSILCVLCVLCG
jgi:hypothetical protein